MKKFSPVIVLLAIIVSGCTSKPWPDSVLPNADANASLPDDVLKQADANSKFKGQK
jgi:hypothetical protein